MTLADLTGTERDIALAMLINTEGHIGLQLSGGRNKGYRYPTLKLNMAEESKDLVELSAAWVGARVQGPYHSPSRKRHQRTYVWVLIGWPALDVLMRVRPWLTEYKAKRADELLVGYQERQRRDGRTTCFAGHELTPDNIYVYPNGKRQCLACRRAWGGYKGTRERRQQERSLLYDADLLRAEYEIKGAGTIAQELGCSTPTVLNHLRRHGIEIRPPGHRVGGLN